MKTKILPLLLLLTISLATTTVNAQMRKIPAVVTEAFKARYPHASNVEWSDKISSFMARFTDNDHTYEAKFNSKGEWLSTETQIPVDEIPGAVNDGYGKSRYADWEIQTVHRIQLPGNTIQYRIFTQKSDLQKRNLFFSTEGRLLRENITL